MRTLPPTLLVCLNLAVTLRVQGGAPAISEERRVVGRNIAPPLAGPAIALGLPEQSTPLTSTHTR